jgi:hypothetical protein
MDAHGTRTAEGWILPVGERVTNQKTTTQNKMTSEMAKNCLQQHSIWGAAYHALASVVSAA